MEELQNKPSQNIQEDQIQNPMPPGSTISPLNDVDVPKEESNADNRGNPENNTQSDISEKPKGQQNIATDNTSPIEQKDNDIKNKSTTQTPKKTHSKRDNILVAVIIAVLIGLLLIGLVYAAYNSTKDKESAQTENTVTVEEAPKTQAATSDDVSKNVAEIDNIVKELDQQESVNSTDISDSALGL